MTYEEAIKAIKCNYPPERYSMLREALNMAMETFEYRMSKKPTHQYKRLGFVVEGCCPSCEDSVLPEQNYCSHCGQALDWSEEEWKD